MNKQDIVVGIIKHENNIVLIKRSKEPFKNTLILPGGKIEKGESPDEAIEREILEETGLKTKEKKVVGNYNELVLHKETTYNHRIIIYQIIPESFNYQSSNEGETFHINFDEIAPKKSEINPSDYRMLERILLNNQEGFKAKIVVEKKDGNYKIISEEDLQ